MFVSHLYLFSCVVVTHKLAHFSFGVFLCPYVRLLKYYNLGVICNAKTFEKYYFHVHFVYIILFYEISFSTLTNVSIFF